MSSSYVDKPMNGVDSPVFPNDDKILMSLNMNHPIGIHATNSRGFPDMCRLCLGSDESLAETK